MQNTKIINIILGTILIVAIAGMLIVIKSPTGMIVPGTPVQKPMLTGAPADYWKDIELKDYIYEFFETEKFYFRTLRLNKQHKNNRNRRILSRKFAKIQNNDIQRLQ